MARLKPCPDANHENQFEDGRLLLEEVVEGAAGVVGARRTCGERRGRRLGRGGRGVLFDRGAKFVERAIVAHVFARDALGHGLHALEARGAIEIAALLAGVQIEGAARALRVRIGIRLEHGAAARRQVEALMRETVPTIRGVRGPNCS